MSDSTGIYQRFGRSLSGPMLTFLAYQHRFPPRILPHRGFPKQVRPVHRRVFDLLQYDYGHTLLNRLHLFPP